MPVLDSKFSNFADGGDLTIDDIVVGLRNGINTRFSYQGEPPGIYLPLAGGTMAGSINMDNNSITNVPAPVAGGDAVNKTYVDGLTAPVGAAGTIQRSDGSNWVPSTATFADTYGINTILYASAADTVTGLATVNRAALSTNATGVPTWLALTDGQIVIGSTAGAPAAATLTAGTGINITIGANSIQIDSTGSGVTWSNIAGTTQAAAVDNAYVCTNAGATTVTLPATAGLGSTIQVEGLGAGGWILQANTGQTIQIGSGVTSSAGTLTSAAATDNVQVVCIVANTTWRVQRTNSAGLTIA